MTHKIFSCNLSIVFHIYRVPVDNRTVGNDALLLEFIQGEEGVLVTLFSDRQKRVSVRLGNVQHDAPISV